MLLSTQIGIAGLGSVSSVAASSIAAQPQMAGLVDGAAASFMMGSPVALQFAREALPKNRILTEPQAATFEEIQILMGKSAKAQYLSTIEKIASGIISTGVATLPALIAGLSVYQKTGSVAAGAGAGVAAGVGAGIICCEGDLTLARFLDGPLSFVSRRTNTRSLGEVESFLRAPTTIQDFFAEHPDAYVSFLRENVSATFRQKEGEAKSRIDALNAKIVEVKRKLMEQERAILASDIPDDNKEILLAEVRFTAKEAQKKLGEAIEKEDEFVSAVNVFIEEILEMEGAIGRELAARNLHEGVRQFVAFAEEVDRAVATAEDQRIAAVIDLATYWGHLREMGDNLSFRLQATLEVSQALLEPHILLSSPKEKNHPSPPWHNSGRKHAPE